MSDRTALLAAIEAQPSDDTVRLAYADWLDEHGASDLDTATAEFIRLSCKYMRRKRETTPAKVIDWLHGRNRYNANGYIKTFSDYEETPNWHRLVPSLVLQLFDGGWAHIAPFEGRTVTVIASRSRPDRYDPITQRMVRPSEERYSFTLEFWRGFLRRVEFKGHQAAEVFLPALVEDQPLCEPRLDAALFVDTTFVQVTDPTMWKPLVHAVTNKGGGKLAEHAFVEHSRCGPAFAFLDGDEEPPRDLRYRPLGTFKFFPAGPANDAEERATRAVSLALKRRARTATATASQPSETAS